MPDKISFEKWIEQKGADYVEALKRGETMSPADIARRIKARGEELKARGIPTDKSRPRERM